MKRLRFFMNPRFLRVHKNHGKVGIVKSTQRRYQEYKSSGAKILSIYVLDSGNKGTFAEFERQTFFRKRQASTQVSSSEWQKEA